MSTHAIAASAQPIPNPLEPEAPESLLELDIGDAEVDLFLSGGWSTGIGGGIGITAYRGTDGTLQTVFPSPFPGLETVPFFNRVDLTLSLWLLNRYFLETSVSDEFQISTLLLGYEGMPGEFVQSVLIGNTAIEMGEYPYLGFGDSTGTLGRDAPGVAALFETPTSTHEFMVRLEPSEEVVIRYVGGRIVRESLLDSALYVRDRHFVLPDPSLDTLSVYVESVAGSLTGSDGRTYRLVDLSAETSFSLATGTLSFSEVPSGRVLVYYESAGVAVGDPTLGEDSFYLLSDGHPDANLPASFSFEDPEQLLSVFGVDDGWPAQQAELEAGYFRVQVDGRDSLVLYEPGRYSPFEVANVYEPPVVVDAPTGIGFVLDDGTSADLALETFADIDRTSVSVTPRDGSPRGYASRYPFASPALANPVPEIYGPGGISAASRVSLAFRQATEATSIVVDGQYVPGSFRVTRNGISTSDFDVLDTGELVFTPPLSDLDSITVRYRTSAAAGNGDLLIGVGNRFTPGDNFSADLALGLRWKPIQSSYSGSAGEYPGYIAISGSTEYTIGSLSARARAGASYGVSDTTGALRVNGMNRTADEVRMLASSVFPGPVPLEDPNPDTDMVAINADTRGELYYRDFTSPGFFGERELQVYQWIPPAAQIYDYADGGRIGPCTALSADAGPGDYAGDVMVMEYRLAEDRNWVAGMSRVNGGLDSDLSGTTRIEGSFRALDDGTGVRVFLQIGALAEDIDGDARIDAGPSATNPYLSFDDPASGWTLAAGAVNPAPSSAYREDADGDGRPDPELPDLVLTRELPAVNSAGGWQQFSFELDRDERRLLRAVRSVRFVVQRDSPGGERTGSLVFSNLSLHGTAFIVTAPASATVVASEVPETYVGVEAFATAFPAVAARMDGEFGEPSVLQVNWSGLGTESFTLSQGFDPVPASDYGEIRLHVTGDGATTGTITMRALSGADRSVVAATSGVIGDEWSLLTLALPDDSGAAVHRVEIEVSGQDTGTVLMDELSFWVPRDSFGATGSVTVEWRPDGSLDIGGHRVADSLTVSQSLRAESSGFADGLSQTATGVEGSTLVSARLLGALVRAGVDARTGPAGPGLQARHELTVPITPVRTTLTEEFRRSYLAYGESLSHHLQLRAGPYGPLVLGAGWQVDRQPESAATEWDAQATLAAAGDRDRQTSAALSVRASEGLESTLPPGAYPSAWALTFLDMTPSGNAASDRTLQLDGSFSQTGPLAGITLEAVAETSAAGDAGPYEVVLEAVMSVPLTAGDRVRITPSVGRSSRTQSYATHEPRFAADAAEAARVLGRQPYLLTAVPIWELWDPGLPGDFELATDGFAAAGYEPSFGLEFSRPIRSSPWALLVPSRAQLTITRELSRRDDAVASSTGIATELTTVAPNVFGRLGSAPLFGFYDSDEFTASVAATVKTDDTGRREVEVDVDQDIRLLWLSGESLEFTSTFAGGFTGGNTAAGSEARLGVTVDGDYHWTRPATVLSRFQRLARFAESGANLEHSESLRLAAEWEENTSQSLTAMHSTLLTLTESSSVQVYGGIGFGLTQVAGTSYFRTGLQLGIEGRLRF